MPAFPKTCTAAVIPTLRYKDAPAAIEWLCQALGFAKHAVFPNADGTIAHAQLTFGNGMIMLGSQNDQLHDQQSRQSTYLVVNDADAVYANVKAQGAAITREITDESYGGRGFTCRDLEGHLWAVGTFDPWV